MKITKVKVTNFKSLQKVRVNGFSDTNMIFGMNNSGKSNLLKLLELIFKSKEKKDVITFQEGSEEVDQVVAFDTTNFWDGFIYNSPFLYWKDNSSEGITFSISMEVSKDEMNVFNKELFNDLKEAGFFNKLATMQFKFEGKIRPIGGFDSEIVLEKVILGDKEIFTT